MRYLICLSVSSFYIKQTISTWEAYDATRPLVIWANKHVIDSDSLARKKQVGPGLELSKAKALLDRAQFVEWNSDAFEDARSQWLNVLPLFSGVIEPGLSDNRTPKQHMAFLDLSGHPHPEQIVPRLIDHLESEIQANVRWGAAQTKWLAELAMRFDAGDLAVNQPQALLSLLPVSELTPVLPEHRERLHFLGYPTIGRVAELSQSVLFGQFQKEAIKIHAAACGDWFEPIHALYPERTIHFTFRFEGAVQDELAFDYAIQQLSQSAGVELSQLESVATRIRIVVETESSFKVLTRELQKPISSVLSCRVTLASFKPSFGSESVLSLRVFLEGLEKRPRVQRELRYQALGEAHLASGTKIKVIQQTIQSVQKTHGLDALKLGSELVIPREQRVIRQWEKALGTQRI